MKKTSILFLTMVLPLIIISCGMMSPSIKKDVSYGKSLEFEKAFDCAIRAARDIGFQIKFSDSKVGTFSAAKMGRTELSANYEADFLVDKNTSVISINLREFNAGIPASKSKLSKILMHSTLHFRNTVASKEVLGANLKIHFV